MQALINRIRDLIKQVSIRYDSWRLQRAYDKGTAQRGRTQQ